jgi:hypothetical protein
MPTHARLLEPLIEDHFAARFGDPAADRVATTFTVGKVHVLAILFQVVQPRVVILLRTLQPHSTFLLGRTGDHFRHAIAVVPEHMPLLLGPGVGSLAAGNRRCPHGSCDRKPASTPPRLSGRLAFLQTPVSAAPSVDRGPTHNAPATPFPRRQLAERNVLMSSYSSHFLRESLIRLPCIHEGQEYFFVVSAA